MKIYNEKELIDKGYVYVKSLPAVINDNSKTLILGSLPGPKSIENEFYYSNGGNHFWETICDITGNNIPTTKEEKLELLKNTHIALWDVYESGYRIRGKDGIKNGKPNKIPELLKQYPSIEQIVVAGNDAQDAFIEFFDLDIKTSFVPSTSSANGWWNRKKHEWYELRF